MVESCQIMILKKSDWSKALERGSDYWAEIGFNVQKGEYNFCFEDGSGGTVAVCKKVWNVGVCEGGPGHV